MGLYHTNLEERVRDVDLTNSAINRITHCYNIASEEIRLSKIMALETFILLILLLKLKLWNHLIMTYFYSYYLVVFL